MKIIKDGNKPDMDISRIFRCKSCQCVFEADKGEYEWTWTNPQMFEGESTEFHLKAKCPCCNMPVESVERMHLA